MLLKRFLLLLAVSVVPLSNMGCGAKVAEGVADAPDEPVEEMTEDEEAAERQAARDAAN